LLQKVKQGSNYMIRRTIKNEKNYKRKTKKIIGITHLAPKDRT